MSNSRRRFLAQSTSGFCVMLAGRRVVAAQTDSHDYPDRAIRLIVPFAPGAGADALARLVALKLGARTYMNQTVLVENRPGAGGLIAAQYVARAPADGYTLFLANVAPNAIDVSYRPDTAFNASSAFAPVTQLASAPLILCCPGTLKEKTLRDVIDAAKAKPGSFSYASAGAGSIAHLTNELFDAKVGIRATHIPYAGTAPAVVDLIAGRVSLLFTSTISVLPQIRAGHLRALAIADKQRSPLLPDVPTMDECGVSDFDIATWHGIVAPRATPDSIIRKLYTEIVRVLQSDEVKKQFEALGAIPVGSDPAAFGSFIGQEVRRWAKAVQVANARSE